MSVVVTLLFVVGMFLDVALVLFSRFMPYSYSQDATGFEELDPEIGGLVGGCFVAGVAIADGILAFCACVEDPGPRRGMAVARVVIECFLIIFLALLLLSVGRWHEHWRCVCIFMSLAETLMLTGFAAMSITRTMRSSQDRMDSRANQPP